MGSHVHYQSGPSVFKKLVRLVARTFYSGPCPPRPDGPISRRKWDRVDTTGIAIIILDNLTQQEWVREEHLLQELKIAPKLLLKALRHLREERILRCDSRKEGKRAQAKDIVVLATKKETPHQDATESDAPAKPLLQTYWAIDYPSFWDVLRLRLHLMRFKIRSEVEDTSTVVDYECPNPQCGNRYTTFDFRTLLDHKTGRMICENCGSEVLEESGHEGGGIGKMEDRGKKRDDMKAMLKRMDTELKVILDLVNQAKDIKPPDYGSLADWAYEQNAKKAKQLKGAQKGSGEKDVTFDMKVTESTSSSGAAREKRPPANAAKEVPPWMAKLHQPTRTKEEENKKATFKKRAADILPPPVDIQPSRTSLTTLTAAAVVSTSPSSLAHKRIKIETSNKLPPALREDDDDGIEWEQAGMSEDKGPEIQREEIPFDKEAARLADIESDLRTNSGWTTVQK